MATRIDVSRFEDKWSSVVAEHLCFSSWTDCRNWLKSRAEIEWYAKWHAPLFAPTEFSAPEFSPPDDDHPEGQWYQRRLSKALRAGMVVLDVDGAATIPEVRAKINDYELAACIYTSGRHSPGLHKFRVVVPLREPVSATDYRLCQRALDVLLTDGRADPQPKNCTSMFYQPGRYGSAGENLFLEFDGAQLGLEEYVDLVPPKVETEEEKSARIAAGEKAKKALRRRKLRGGREISWSLMDCEFVTSDMINDYTSCSGTDSHYRGMFRFMCRVAVRALRRGVEVSAYDLGSLADELDRHDGGWYQRGQRKRDFRKEADNAIRWASSHLSL